MVLVQLFIIKIALSNWAAPFLPLHFVIIPHSSTSSVMAHAQILTADVDARFHHHYSVNGFVAIHTIKA